MPADDAAAPSSSPSPAAAGAADDSVVRPDDPPPRRGLPIGVWVAALVIVVGGGLLAIMLWPSGKSDGKRSVALADPTPDAFQLALSEGQRAFGCAEYEPSLAAYRRAGALQPGSSAVAAGLRQLDAVAARLFTAGKKLEVSDPAGAVAKWRVSAALGNANGQGGLGFMYESGRGGLAKDDRGRALVSQGCRGGLRPSAGLP